MTTVRVRSMSLVIAFGAVVGGVAALAQSAAPAAQTAAVPPALMGPPPGRGGLPLPALPAVYRTAQQDIRVSIVARGLRQAWSLLILPDGDMLVSLRYTGEVRAIRKGVLDPAPVKGLPAMWRIYDLAMHPNFAGNKWIYFGYAKTIVENQSAMTLARARYEGGRFTDAQDLYVGDWTRASPAGGSRIAFAPDGTVYMTISGATQAPPRPGDPLAPPRRLDTIFGKVIRLRDDGTVPPDNPFVGKAGARPEIYSIGHRDHFGIAPHPVTGQMFHAELGPLGGDKINILKAGGDYGWPDYGYGRHNDSSPMGNPSTPGIEPALLVWLPGITPSGLLFYTGDRFPAWKGNLMVCSTTRGRIKEATGVERVVFNDKMWELRRETFLSDLKQRMRDIRQGPDGLIYLLTEEEDGVVLKVEPAS
jgi:glucose/arabinose dehydrogenase